MNNQNYGAIQWIQQHVANEVQISNTAKLIVNGQSFDDAEILQHGIVDNGTDDYLITPNDAEDLAQIAAENLIFMAREGQVDDIITSDDNDCGVIESNENNLDNTASVLGPQKFVVEADNFNTVFAEVTPQMITEEIITDDWVQHQGAERVEISAEQIIGNNSSQVLLDMVQDEYTALRPYPCDFCSRRFRKKTSLNNHMIAHQNDRPHPCKLCGARFSRRAELINHFKAHAEEQAANEEVEANLLKMKEHTIQLDNQYNENSWPIVTNSTESSKSSNENSVTQSISSVSTATSTVPRGRISRLKPKDDSQYMTTEQKPSVTDLDYVVCHDLQPSTAAVKLIQNQSPVHQPLYPVIDENKPFVCQQCGLAFAREKALMSHTKSHRVDSPFECDQCQEMFWDTNSLQEHQKAHQFEESNSEFDPNEAEETQSDSESEKIYGDFFCSECGISFHRNDLLQRHVKTHLAKRLRAASNGAAASDTNEAALSCSTCGETFAEALDLLAHAEVHARFPPFKCVLCGESFFEELAIKRHLHGRHSSEMTPNSCILCGKECRDRKALIKHAWDHSREKCHSCSKCGKNFHNKARLKRHMSSHRNKSVICETCNEEFPDGRSLSNHRHSHSVNSNAKQFPCHECGKTFGSRSSQQIHVRIHTGERPYGCRFCWKAFADGGTLRKHERIHTGEKPYACSVCPRAFNQRVVLREHIRSHHSGIDPALGKYFCSVCSAELGTSNDLIKHLIQHSDSNTAKQRQPVPGPRKYKRRRKLQPHEIANLREEIKLKNYDSEMDISDFDIDSVDDLLAITESSTKRKIPQKRKATSKAPKSIAKTKVQVKTEAVATQNSEKPRFDSTSTASEKLWDSKFMETSSSTQDDSYKNLFSNVERGLQSITELVVSHGSSSKNTNNARKGKQKSSSSSSGAQRTQEVKLKGANEKYISKSRSCKKAKNSQKSNVDSQTDKWDAPAIQDNLDDNGYRRTRSKMYQTRNQTSNIDLLQTKTSSSMSQIVDDYEIISPATKPPKQISSSPLHIKQEQEPQQKQNQLQHIFDAHLLLEASGLRKEAYEKFNPSIVNDLEEILRSPLKSERSERLRFISESSTTGQYLPDDDHNLIKIEPISPNLQEIVESSRTPLPTSSPSTMQLTTNTSAMQSTNANSKYLADNKTAGLQLKETTKRKHSSKQSAKLNPNTNINTTHTTTASVTNYLNYGIDTYANSGTSNSDVTSNFFSISEVVSAADANEAARVRAAAAAAAAAKAANANNGKTKHKIRQFECEMCSAVFSDRAQLLEHVHIHI